MNNLKNNLKNEQINVLIDSLTFYKNHLKEQSQIFSNNNKLVSFYNNDISIIDDFLLNLY